MKKRTLEGAEDAGTGRGAGQTDVEERAEGGGTLAVVLDVELLAIDEHVALVADRELGIDAASEQQAGRISGGVVGQTDGQAVTLQLVRVRGRNAHVVLDVRGEDLADNVTVGLRERGKGGNTRKKGKCQTERHMIEDKAGTKLPINRKEREVKADCARAFQCRRLYRKTGQG